MLWQNNQKIIVMEYVCRLPGPDWQQYTDKFKLLGIDKHIHEIAGIEWTDNSNAVQKEIDKMTTDSY